MYCRLLAATASQWKSSDPVPQGRHGSCFLLTNWLLIVALGEDVEECINLLFRELEEIHGETFVRHALGCLTLATRGLSDNEMEDILSCDDTVLNEVKRPKALQLT